MYSWEGEMNKGLGILIVVIVIAGLLVFAPKGELSYTEIQLQAAGFDVDGSRGCV